jgi:hypothetical protein
MYDMFCWQLKLQRRNLHIPLLNRLRCPCFDGSFSLLQASRGWPDHIIMMKECNNAHLSAGVQDEHSLLRGDFEGGDGILTPAAAAEHAMRDVHKPLIFCDINGALGSLCSPPGGIEMNRDTAHSISHNMLNNGGYTRDEDVPAPLCKDSLKPKKVKNPADAPEALLLLAGLPHRNSWLPVAAVQQHRQQQQRRPPTSCSPGTF